MIRCWDRADFMPNFIIHSFNNVSADERRGGGGGGFLGVFWRGGG